jgi:hypothetical protein
LTPSHLPSHIVDAWTFVHGARWHFEALPEGASPIVDPALALTVALRSQGDLPSLLVGCLIRQDHAEALARHMFDAPAGDVSADDVRDAGQEACNVLAGSVIASSADPAQLHIGLPQALTQQQYADIRSAASVRACFVGRPTDEESTIHVVLTLFDLPPSSPVVQENP